MASMRMKRVRTTAASAMPTSGGIWKERRRHRRVPFAPPPCGSSAAVGKGTVLVLRGGSGVEGRGSKQLLYDTKSLLK
jgi:hypothetical protein